MNKQDDAPDDVTPRDWVAKLVWNMIKIGLRLFWSLVLAVFASLCAAFILLLGPRVALDISAMAIWLSQMLIKSAFGLILVLVVSALLSAGSLWAVASMARRLPSDANAFPESWRRLRRIQRTLHRVIEGVRASWREQSRDDQVMTGIGLILVMTIALSFTYLSIWGLGSWDEIRNAKLPPRVPEPRVGRNDMWPVIGTVPQAAAYERARREKVAEKTKTVAEVLRKINPQFSPCGRTHALLPAEYRMIGKLAADVIDGPPIVKNEYVLTEEQLTEAFSLFLASEKSSGVAGCIKLQAGRVQLFMMGRDARSGAAERLSAGITLSKDAGGLRMLLDEVSDGRTPLHLGWLELGARDDRIFLGEGEELDEVEGWLRKFDAGVFSISVNEGYLRIVTWRVSSVIAARSARDVGHSRETVDHKVEPRDEADSLGKVAPTDLVYLLETTGAWSYVCSEASGRCGWLRSESFVSLASDPLFMNGS